ncbi:MAG: IS3 family transposase [Oscillospiraceae bacterium]|nr:IS3 family transposase [Oscillospiraceae bacterium]
MGLYSIRLTAKKEYSKIQKSERKLNLLKQNFNADVPNKVWISDVTLLKLKDRYYYLCAIIDLYSRKVISYNISRSDNTHLITETLRGAIACRHAKGVIFHSDRGSSYVSYTAAKVMKKNGIVQSFSKKGTPHDNAVMESFFASLKREEYYRSNYRSEVDLKRRIGKYIEFYNTERPHGTLGHMTPEEKEDSFRKAGAEKAILGE